jgi:hypothetical protein
MINGMDRQHICLWSMGLILACTWLIACTYMVHLSCAFSMSKGSAYLKRIPKNGNMRTQNANSRYARVIRSFGLIFLSCELIMYGMTRGKGSQKTMYFSGHLGQKQSWEFLMQWASSDRCAVESIAICERWCKRTHFTTRIIQPCRRAPSLALADQRDPYPW